MKASTLEVFEIIKRFVKNEKDAKILVHYWEDANETQIVKTVESKIGHLATKEELFDFRQEITEKFSSLESRLTWKMFAFFVGQFIGQCVLLFTALKFIL